MYKNQHMGLFVKKITRRTTAKADVTRKNVGL